MWNPHSNLFIFVLLAHSVIIKKCVEGGLYFCRYENFGLWVNYNGNGPMEYIWDVNIPESEKVVDMNNKLKAHSIILSNKRSIWDNYELCLEAVKQNGSALQCVREKFETNLV